MKIERHRQIARLLVADDLEEHGKKAENGVGKHAVLVGKRRQGVEGAVHEAVAIHDDKGIRLRHGVLLFQMIFGHDYDTTKGAKIQTD